MSNAVCRLKSLRVSDVMATHVVQIGHSQTLAAAARLFVQHEVSAAPVVDDDGRCVGVLSATDFLKHDAAEHSQVASTANAAVPAEDGLASDFMSTAVQSIAADAPMLDAARIMTGAHIHRLLVLDRDARPAGVISTMDIVAALLNSVDEMSAGREREWE